LSSVFREDLTEASFIHCSLRLTETKTAAANTIKACAASSSQLPSDSRRAITLAFGLLPFGSCETVPQMAVFDEARQGVHDQAGT
jgi:hypothetical protein